MLDQITLDLSKKQPAQDTILLNGIKVDKGDRALPLLDAIKTAKQRQTQHEGKLNKLIERINLDRPVLQSEKIRLILEEVGQQSDAELNVNQIRANLKQV